VKTGWQRENPKSMNVQTKPVIAYILYLTLSRQRQRQPWHN
jgi:hypothetical protein